MQEALKREFITDYLMQDGLCLGHGEKPTIKPDGTTAVGNDNGILFAVYGYFLFAKELDGADSFRFNGTIKSLEVQPGLYNRRPGDNGTPEAHDNASAIAAGSVLFDRTFARDICDYGEQYGWSFTNTNPGNWAIRQLRQGGEIAFYKICAGRLPYPIEMAWLCLGLLHSLFFGWSSQWNLAWLKLKAMPIALDRYATGASWSWVTSAWHITASLGWLIAKKRKLFPRSFIAYFGENHVISRKAKE